MLAGEGPAGDYAAGDFDLDNALSVADALGPLLEKPWKPRSWLARFRPRDKSTSTDPITTIAIDVSSDGHRGKTGEDWDGSGNTVQFHKGLITPYSMTFGLGKRLWGVAETSFGEVVIGDPRAENRSWAGEDWNRRQADIYLGPQDGTIVQFAKVAQLLSIQLGYDRSTLSVIVDDYSFILDRPLHTSFYAGTGGLNGTSNMEGEPRPELLGVRKQFRPKLVDPINRVYQVHNGSFDELTALYDQLDSTAYTFATDLADITTWTPVANQYATSLATGYIRLGSDPNGLITCDAKGHDSSTYGYVDDIVGLLKLLTVVYPGDDGLDDPAELDTVALNTLSSHTAPMGEYFDKPITIRQAIAKFAQSAAAYVWLKPGKVLTAGRITDPGAASADFTLNAQEGQIAKGKNQVRREPWKVDPYEKVVGRVFVYYRPYVNIKESDIASGVSLANREDYTKDWRVAKAEMTAGEQIQNSQFAELHIFTNLDVESDAQALADEQLALRKAPTYLLECAPRVGLIKRGIGDVFELTDPRLHSSPMNFVILNVENAAGVSGRSDQIVWRCFGTST